MLTRDKMEVESQNAKTITQLPKQGGLAMPSAASGALQRQPVRSHLQRPLAHKHRARLPLQVRATDHQLESMLRASMH